jgi:hypothetical protein
MSKRMRRLLVIIALVLLAMSAVASILVYVV